MEANEKTQDSRKIVKFVIILMLIIMAIVLSGLAYARYVTQKRGQAQAQIAKWSFIVRLGSQEITEDFLLANTRTDNNQNMIDSNTIAPGTKGVIPIELNASQSNVSISYNVKLNFSNKPKNLHLYRDSNYLEEVFVKDNSATIAGEIGVNDQIKIDNVNLYWDWPLESGEFEEDIEENDIDDSRYMGKSLVCNIEVIGLQKEPGKNTNSLANIASIGDYVNYNEGTGYSYIATGEDTGTLEAINSEDIERSIWV